MSEACTAIPRNGRRRGTKNIVAERARVTFFRRVLPFLVSLRSAIPNGK